MELTTVFYGTSLTAMTRWSDLLGADVVNTAQSSMDSAWGLANVQPRVIDQHPAQVVIEFAMNDAYAPYGMTLAESAATTTAIVRAIEAAQPDVQIWLMTTNEPWGAGAAARPDLDAYYAQYRTLAHDLGVGLIDLQPVWAARSATADAPDGVHPSLAADETVILPAVNAALGMAWTPTAPGAFALSHGLSGASLTAFLYENYLHREPGSSELPWWQSLAPELQVQGISHSAEALAWGAA